MAAPVSRYKVPVAVLDAPHTCEFEVSKSRFITWMARCRTPDEAQALLHAARQAYRDARHHCTAFVAGAPGEQFAIGFSDDGEPGGTAGRPMYQVLEGSQLGEIGCVVIRYFGGIKLGTGGLARAYAKAVQLGLEHLPTREHTVCVSRRLHIDFSDEHTARQWCEQHGASVTGVDYGAQGVVLALEWPQAATLEVDALTRQLHGHATLLSP